MSLTLMISRDIMSAIDTPSRRFSVTMLSPIINLPNFMYRCMYMYGSVSWTMVAGLSIEQRIVNEIEVKVPGIYPICGKDVDTIGYQR